MSQHLTVYAPAMLAQPQGGIFVRGAVTAGCLSAFQDRPQGETGQGRRILRHALQGGMALAAGTHAAAAWCECDYTRALVATVTGAAGVLLLEQLLCQRAQPSQEKSDV
jgi:hypothetical protein